VTAEQIYIHSILNNAKSIVHFLPRLG